MARPHEAPRTHAARRRFAASVLAVVGIAGLGIASAAQLNLGSGTLGVGTTTIATCQGAGIITTNFPTAWNTAISPNAYRVTAVTLSGVNVGCNGKAYRIQLLNSAGVAIGTEITGTVSGTTFTTPAVAATGQALAVDVTGVTIVIVG